MFLQVFTLQLADFTDDKILRRELTGEVEKRYSSPRRHYHNLSHLDNLVGELADLRPQVNDWPVMVFSIAYHDFVYNTLRKDNEERSAKTAVARLTRLKIADAQRQKCFVQIMATKGHTKNPDHDTNLFTDADLAILGADPQRYALYEKNIRKEYRFYPDSLYNHGRRGVLANFLSMPRIFKTSPFHDKYEQQARINMNNELASLNQ